MCAGDSPFVLEGRADGAVIVVLYMATLGAACLEQRAVQLNDILRPRSMVETINVLCDDGHFPPLRFQPCLQLSDSLVS